MKITLCLVCLLFAATAFGQATAGGGALSNEPVALAFPSHNLHASSQAMSEGESLIGNSSQVSAQGQRPLWEVAPPSAPVTPLGDTARALKKDRANAKKAQIVWQN